MKQLLRVLCYALMVGCILHGNSSLAQRTLSQEPQLTRILFLYDASQSMYGQWQSGTKMDVAKKLLSELVDSLRKEERIELALHVYGHLKKFPPQDCDDNRLEIPFSKNNHDQIIAKLGTIKPSGTTPIARSLEECERDFPDNKARNVIVLITDGIEECSGDPCAVSKALQLKGIMLKPFVIGIGNNADYQKTFDCVGTYFNAANETSFKTILNVVISQALNNTTAQVNLLDNYGKPTETDVNMSFYDEFSGALKYNFIHTMNHRGLPDTLRLDPLSTYRVVVHTLPPVSVDSVVMTPGKHTIIPVDAPQGYLSLKYDGASEYKDLQAIVRLRDSMKTLHVQDFNTVEKYLIGKYDLEILTTPRMLLNDVDVSQSHTTTIQIPQPGMITLLSSSSITGGVFQEEGNQLKWVLNLDSSVQKQTLVLQPGNYKVVMRPKNSKSSDYTVQKTFKISSGTSTNLNLN